MEDVPLLLQKASSALGEVDSGHLLRKMVVDASSHCFVLGGRIGKLTGEGSGTAVESLLLSSDLFFLAQMQCARITSLLS